MQWLNDKGQGGKKTWVLGQRHILTTPGHTVQGNQLNQHFTIFLPLLWQGLISMQDS